MLQATLVRVCRQRESTCSKTTKSQKRICDGDFDLPTWRFHHSEAYFISGLPGLVESLGLSLGIMLLVLG